MGTDGVGGDGQPQEAGAFNAPRKCIRSVSDLEVFTKSKLCEQLLSFVSELSGAIKGQVMAPERLLSASPMVRSLVDFLQTLESWVADLPPVAQPMRFGNAAFRHWHARFSERGEALLLQALRAGGCENGTLAAELAAELIHYLLAAFGDKQRIDYGTGHEASFLAFIFALGARGVLAKADAADAVLLVFATYLKVMRRLQSVYMLEPAGSHGVWGLDDYHALPFLFGAAQLVGPAASCKGGREKTARGLEEEVPTGEIYRERIVQEYAGSYLYVDAVKEVLNAKRGAPFHETSPMLYDISGVATWQKTHSGLLKMYRAEVLGKLPVIQHFLFGPSVPWPGDMPQGAASSAESRNAAAQH